MKIYLSGRTKDLLKRWGARRVVDVALCDPDILSLAGRIRVVTEVKPVTAHCILDRRRSLPRLTTGAKRLDELLGGGLEAGYVTEVAGEFGAGKTQLCHQLAVMVQLPGERGGLGARALYVDTEGTFRPERVVSIAKYRGLDPEEALENIVYVEARDPASLLAAVLEAESLDTKLVIVDTLLAPLIGESGSEGPSRRQYLLSRLVRELRRLAAGGRVVVVANRMSRDRPAGGLVMALGSHYRLLMVKVGGARRRVELLRAPHLPPGSATVVLTEEGVLDA